MNRAFALPSFGSLKKLFDLLGDDKRRTPLLLFAFGLQAVLELVGLTLVGAFVAAAFDPGWQPRAELLVKLLDTLSLHERVQQLSVAGVIVVLAFLVKGIVGYQVNRGIATFSERLQARLRNRLLEAHLHLPLAQAVRRNSSELLVKSFKHIQLVHARMMMPLLWSTASIVMLISIFSYLLYVNWQVTLGVTALLLGVMLIYDWLVKERVRKAGRDILAASSSSTAIMSQTSVGLRDVRVSGAEEFFLDQMKAATDRYARAAIQRSSLNIVPRAILEVVMAIVIVGIVIAGLYTNDTPSPQFVEMVTVFALASFRAMGDTSKLMTARTDMHYGSRALYDLHREMAKADALIRTNPLEHAQGDKAIAFERHIELDDVAYSYTRDGRPALREIHMRIRKGETIGLVGASGSGKTTLVDALLGLLTPTKGDLLVDGRAVRGKERTWMQRAAYVPQTVFLLDDSIVANIAFAVSAQDIDPVRVRQAIELARLDALVDSLPQGAETRVGEHGAMLSGGQRQRIAIARALYHQRDILVMDEATASLDADTEDEVVESLKQLRGQLTIIVIAHRLSTLRYCDRVLVLDQGQIVREGSYREIVLDEVSPTMGSDA